MNLYPYNAGKLTLDIRLNPFLSPSWWFPNGRFRRDLTEEAKANGERIWWVRWLWFQISYSRWS